MPTRKQLLLKRFCVAPKMRDNSDAYAQIFLVFALGICVRHYYNLIKNSLKDEKNEKNGK
jgi:hypothetical protein